jgi:hypothetical protein
LFQHSLCMESFWKKLKIMGSLGANKLNSLGTFHFGDFTYERGSIIPHDNTNHFGGYSFFIQSIDTIHVMIMLFIWSKRFLLWIQIIVTLCGKWDLVKQSSGRWHKLLCIRVVDCLSTAIYGCKDSTMHNDYQ